MFKFEIRSFSTSSSQFLKLFWLFSLIKELFAPGGSVYMKTGLEASSPGLPNKRAKEASSKTGSGAALLVHLGAGSRGLVCESITFFQIILLYHLY